MNELQIFNNADFGQVRTLEIDRRPYFVASDVAKALGYKDAVNAIKQHCRWVVKHHIPHPQNAKKTLEVNIIPEGDLYRLITNSGLPSAEKFESWIFDEVLPTIRKHGLYAVDQLLDDPDFMIKAFTALKEERDKNRALKSEIGIKDQQIAELNPKASYYDVVLQTKDTIAISIIAKDYGKSAVWLNKHLHEKGIQFKQGKMWLLYQKYAEQGYTKTKTEVFSDNEGKQHSKPHTYWTQKGRLFVYDLLKRDGILPLMELEDNNEAS